MIESGPPIIKSHFSHVNLLASVWQSASLCSPSPRRLSDSIKLLRRFSIVSSEALRAVLDAAIYFAVNLSLVSSSRAFSISSRSSDALSILVCVCAASVSDSAVCLVVGALLQVMRIGRVKSIKKSGVRLIGCAVVRLKRGVKS